MTLVQFGVLLLPIIFTTAVIIMGRIMTGRDLQAYERHEQSKAARKRAETSLFRP